MDIGTLVVLLFIGCLIGFLAGFFGVGGGVILVPVLIFLFSYQNVNTEILTHLAMGTSLFIVIFASMSSAVKHTKQGNVYWRAVIIMGIASILFAAIGSYLAASLEGLWLRKFFAATVLFVSIKLLLEKNKNAEIHTEFKPNFIKLASIGGIVGLLSSMTGVGGGVFSIPLMYFFAHFPIKRAIGTSSATILLTASTAAAGYIVNGYGNINLPPDTLGYVDFIQAIPLIIGTVAFGPIGAATAHKTKSNVLKNLFAFFLLANAIIMFLK